jgi:glutathione S-transferase
MIPSETGPYLETKKYEVLADGILDALLLNLLSSDPSSAGDEWRDRQARKVAGGITEVARLIGSRNFAVADRFTLADAAIGTMLAQMNFAQTMVDRPIPHTDWAERHPNLTTYLARISDRPSFQATMPVEQAGSRERTSLARARVD